MKPVGERVNLSFEVNAVRSGLRWAGRFEDMLVGPTCVSLYMKNNTRSCDLQTQALTRAKTQLAAKGVGLIAVSKDTIGSHIRYAQKHGFEFSLVSDPDCKFAQSVDAMVEKTLYGRRYIGPARSAYLLGQDGYLLGIVEPVESARHDGQLLELVERVLS